MGLAEFLYLGITVVFFTVFAIIVVRTCRKDRKEKLENPKYRMLDNDHD